MSVLFVDDELTAVRPVGAILVDALEIDVRYARTVAEAVEALHQAPVRLLVADLFLPLGRSPGRVLGPRARRYAEQLDHLGGLALLDELDRVPDPPVVLLHTACVDPVLLELLGESVSQRVRKPAHTEVLLDAVLSAWRALA